MTTMYKCDNCSQVDEISHHNLESTVRFNDDIVDFEIKIHLNAEEDQHICPRCFYKIVMVEMDYYKNLHKITQFFLFVVVLVSVVGLNGQISHKNKKQKIKKGEQR